MGLLEIFCFILILISTILLTICWFPVFEIYLKIALIKIERVNNIYLKGGNVKCQIQMDGVRNKKKN